MLLIVLLGGLVLALAGGGEGGSRLDPRVAAPSGARAVAELLRDQGVTVDLVHDERRHGADHAGPGDTLLVVDPDLLADSQVEAVRAIGADLVLVTSTTPDRYVPGVTVEPTGPGVRTAGCALPAARRAGAADTGVVGYDVSDADSAGRGSATRGTACRPWCRGGSTAGRSRCSARRRR